MSYKDNEHKTVAIINSKIEPPRTANALGHATAGLMAKMAKANNQDMRFLEYSFSGDWSDSSLINRFPFIILTAKNNNQLRTLHKAVNESMILHNVFTDSMLGASAAEQIEQTKNANMEDLIYFCIVMFGHTEELTPLTKKFSLFKG